MPVVTTIAVGGRRGWEDDVVVPRDMASFQPVGDYHLGRWLVARACCMIPPMLDIAQDVLPALPASLLLQLC